MTFIRASAAPQLLADSRLPRCARYPRRLVTRSFSLTPRIFPQNTPSVFGKRSPISISSSTTSSVAARIEPPRDDLTSLLLSAKDASGAAIPRQQIRDEIVTMFFAGHETGAASISWTLYLLARHPDVATRLATEPAGGPLAHQVLRESLRLYPPAYRVSRTVVRNCHLGSTNIPAGAEVVIPQWAVHRSPRHWAEPNAFQPERWTPEMTKQLPKYAYFPFGGGQRICIGNHFGLHESVRVVTEITRRFELRLAAASQAAPVLGVTLLPREGSLRMEFRRRKAGDASMTRFPESTPASCPAPRPAQPRTA